jgi:hypothetical protein
MNDRNQFPRLGLLLAAVPLMLSNIASPTFFDVERADRPPAPGAADPALFDYNDTFRNTQAGSPDKNSTVYPVKELELADSTCWAAYGFQPTREQTGCCYKAPDKVKVKKQGEPEPPPSQRSKNGFPFLGNPFSLMDLFYWEADFRFSHN